MDSENPRARLYYLFGATQHPHGTPWLARFPVEVFAIAAGLFGLVDAWRRATAYGWADAAVVADILVWPATALWALSLVLYLFKLKRHPQAVLAESRHPVQGSLQALLPLSVLLATIRFQLPGQGVWLVVALLALTLHAVIAVRIVSLLVSGQLPSNAVTPALYLPIVGGALVGSMTLAALRLPGWAAMLFGTGLSGWALLEARILSHLFAGPMPEVLRPTIGTELMPPAIATLAASMIWPQLPAEILMVGIGMAIVPLAVVLARYHWWGRSAFSIRFWSFSFPLACLASVMIETVHRGAWPMWLGIAALLCASAVVGFLALRTVLLMMQGKFLSPA